MRTLLVYFILFYFILHDWLTPTQSSFFLINSLGMFMTCIAKILVVRYSQSAIIGWGNFNLFGYFICFYRFCHLNSIDIIILIKRKLRDLTRRRWRFFKKINLRGQTLLHFMSKDFKYPKIWLFLFVKIAMLNQLASVIRTRLRK
jgi:hypothetical protein